MIKRLCYSSFVFFGLIVGMPSCYIADEFFLPEPEQALPSLQKSCEDAVTFYIQARLNSELYKPYGFGDIIIHKPMDIAILEQLEANRKNGLETGPKLDSLIEEKRHYISENKIERTVSIDHFFTIKNNITQKIIVLESNYLLNDTLGVEDFKPKIVLELPEKYEESLNFYFFEYTIFLSPVYTEGQKLSREFYAFFKGKLESINNVNARSAFLLHTLKLTKTVKEKGEFNQQEITEYLVKTYYWQQLDSSSNYIVEKFSPLFQKTIDEKVSGYYIFHKFSGLLGNPLDTSVVRADFTAYYELESITEMERPFEPYFNN